MDKGTARIIIGFLVMLLILVSGVFVWREIVRKNQAPSNEFGEIARGIVSFKNNENLTAGRNVEVSILSGPGLMALKTDSPYLPILLTGVFTLLGSAIVLLFNFFSTRSARKFEWAKHIWDKYEGTYLLFRNAVESTLDADLLARHMEDLRNKAFVPRTIESSFNSMVSLLTSATTEDERRKNLNSFIVEFDVFMVEPWEYI